MLYILINFLTFSLLPSLHVIAFITIILFKLPTLLLYILPSSSPSSHTTTTTGNPTTYISNPSLDYPSPPNTKTNIMGPPAPNQFPNC